MPKTHSHKGYGYLTTPLRQMLADGEWHELNLMTAELMHTIKPELATRRYQRSGHGKKPSTTLDHQVLQGSRYIVWDALRRIDGMEKRGDRYSGFQFRLPLIRARTG